MSLLNLDEKKSPCGVLIDQNAWIRSTHCARCSTSPGPAWYRPQSLFPSRRDRITCLRSLNGQAALSNLQMQRLHGRYAQLRAPLAEPVQFLSVGCITPVGGMRLLGNEPGSGRTDGRHTML